MDCPGFNQQVTDAGDFCSPLVRRAGLILAFLLLRLINGRGGAGRLENRFASGLRSGMRRPILKQTRRVIGLCCGDTVPAPRWLGILNSVTLVLRMLTVRQYWSTKLVPREISATWLRCLSCVMCMAGSVDGALVQALKAGIFRTHHRGCRLHFGRDGLDELGSTTYRFGLVVPVRFASPPRCGDHSASGTTLNADVALYAE
jgi:hypothetical protein